MADNNWKLRLARMLAPTASRMTAEPGTYGPTPGQRNLGLEEAGIPHDVLFPKETPAWRAILGGALMGAGGQPTAGANRIFEERENIKNAALARKKLADEEEVQKATLGITKAKQKQFDVVAKITGFAPKAAEEGRSVQVSEGSASIGPRERSPVVKQPAPTRPPDHYVAELTQKWHEKQQREKEILEATQGMIVDGLASPVIIAELQQTYELVPAKAKEYYRRAKAKMVVRTQPTGEKKITDLIPQPTDSDSILNRWEQENQ